MPELPEMENYKILLNKMIKGQTIQDVFINREKSINIAPQVFINLVKGQNIVHVTRRAKHLLFHLENGYVLLLHLMLGGWMYFGTDADKPKRTIQIQFVFGEKNLYFIGLRLGYLHLHKVAEVEKELSNLGPEPLVPEFTVGVFLEHIKSKHGRLKTKLIDQSFLSGIGNCYSDEICYDARILQTRKIEELSQNEAIQLYNSMRTILLEAIKYGGYMANSFFLGDQKTGGYDSLCKVYDREGETCQRCGSTITKEKISSRKTFYCLGCQK